MKDQRDALGRVLHMGCGALVGLVLGGWILLRAWRRSGPEGPPWGWQLLFVFVLGFALLAWRFGDRMWDKLGEFLSGWWRA